MLLPLGAFHTAYQHFNSPRSWPACSADLVSSMLDELSGERDAKAADQLQAPQDFLQPANSPFDKQVCIHTSIHSAVFAPNARELSHHERCVFEAPSDGCSHPLHALARQGRRTLEHHDAVVRAEAAAAAGCSSGRSTPWWQAAQRQHGNAQASSSIKSQSAQETVLSWWRNGSPKLPPPGYLTEASESEGYPEGEPMPMKAALALLKAFPGTAFLQPDLEEV